MATSLSAQDWLCSDVHLAKISQQISDWKGMAPFLGLSETDEQDIITSAPNCAPWQRIAMLRKWRQKLGTAATYRNLANAFRQCGRQDLVDFVSHLLVETRGERSMYDIIMCQLLHAYNSLAGPPLAIGVRLPTKSFIDFR